MSARSYTSSAKSRPPRRNALTSWCRCARSSMHSTSGVTRPHWRRFVAAMRKKETRDIVLVVDDSPETLRMLTDALEEAGMTVLVAREGEYALSIIERVLPDIIL